MSSKAQDILKHFNIHSGSTDFNKTASGSELIKKADDICGQLKEALSKAEVVREFATHVYLSAEEQGILNVLRK